MRAVEPHVDGKVRGSVSLRPLASPLRALNIDHAESATMLDVYEQAPLFDLITGKPAGDLNTTRHFWSSRLCVNIVRSVPPHSGNFWLPTGTYNC